MLSLLAAFCLTPIGLAPGVVAAAPVAPVHDAPTAVLPERERAAFRDASTLHRLETVVPELMRREGIDMWVLIAREYAEDPVVHTMLPATWLSARRRTILIFHDTGEHVERLAVARYDVGELFRSVWNKEEQPDQWRCLADLVAARKPSKIALDVSPTFALSDGLTHSQYEALAAALGEEWMARTVSGERLAIGWLETRTPEELEVYPSLCRIAHEIIAEGFSARGVQPGVTTTLDLEWWFRQRIRERELDTWFHPSVSLQREEQDGSHSGSFASDPGPRTILRGDLLHVDIGITYLGLNTDTQQHAYVLKQGEAAPPAGLAAALADGNRLQDVLLENYIVGRSGNEILAATREQALAEGLVPSIYTHPLGYHGHGAGPTIGLWDQQGGVPGRGDYPLFPNTAYSIELNATVEVPDWGGQPVKVMLEEDAWFDGESVLWLDGRQRELHLIP